MTAATKTEPPQTTGSSVKETFEHILVAFILAFIFRAFVVEAFVIPTGSMAPTLLGAHMRFHCPDCGYAFQVNYPSGSSSELRIPNYMDVAYPIFCANCGLPFVRPEIPQRYPVWYGDRILVQKYIYLFQQPRRWDVVVFKSPVDPKNKDFSDNYIKRLIGRPGEAILILDGDIYVADVRQDLKRGISTQQIPSRLNLEDFKIQSKPPDVQQALWRVVYDNDFRPHRDGWKQPWIATDSSAWTEQRTTRGFRFDHPSASAALVFDPEANGPRSGPGPQHNPDYWGAGFTDWLAYDVETADPRISVPQPVNYVSDLKLDLVYQRHEGLGPLKLQLGKRDHRFTAVITPDSVEILDRDQPIPQTAVKCGPIGLRPTRIQFTNVDYQLTLCIDGKIVAQANYDPDMPALRDEFERRKLAPRPSVQITAQAQSCTIGHLSLWRDVYYLNHTSDGRPQPKWASPRNFPDNLAVLGDKEYFVLGDNSLVSLDARYWMEPIRLPYEGPLLVREGRVPERLLLGRAFLVYWPAGFKPVPGFPIAIIPNFGDMRLIH